MLTRYIIYEDEEDSGDDDDIVDDDESVDGDDSGDIYIMMKCLFVTKNHHFLL